MADRSSRPHRSPARTTRPQVRKIVHLRWKQRLGPVRIAGRLGMPASTVHAVLTRCRINRLSHIDRATGEPVRRYEHDHPGAMLHIDVKKLGNVPDGGGRRYVGRVQGRRNRAATPDRPRNKYRGPLLGTAFVHTVVDDHSRVAYAEICDDEKAATATGVLRRPVDWFAARGVSADGWALGRFYASESARRKALPAWLHHYNHHRPHPATGGKPAITRLTNVPGQYT
jgi:transposase InsO family protein